MQNNLILESAIMNRQTHYKEQNRLRLNRYQELCNLYLGNHFMFDLDNEGDPLVTVNYCAAFVDKAASFLMAPQGNNKLGVRFLPPQITEIDENPRDNLPTIPKPDIGVDGSGRLVSGDPTEEKGKGSEIENEMVQRDKTFNETDIMPFLEAVWETNNKQLTLMEMAQMGGTYGDVFMKVGWREADTQTPIEELSGEKLVEFEDFWGNKKQASSGQGKGEIIISVLDPTLVFPVFDEHNRDRMISCAIIYLVTNPDEPDGDPVVYKEEYTRETITITLGERRPKVYDNYIREIPIVHVRNYVIPGKAFGKADIHDIIQLQLQYNEKITDLSNIITYHAAPVTIVQGGKVQTLERGAKKLWGGLPKDAKVYNLEAKSDLKAARDHVDRLKQSMHELTGVPESSLGKDMAISNTSGVALSIMYQPLLDRRNMKIATYGEGLQRINRLVIKLAEYLRLISIPADCLDKYKTVIDFGDPLPKEQLTELQVMAQEVAVGTKSRITAMKERGVKDPEREFALWLEENKLINYAETEQQLILNSQAQQQTSYAQEQVAQDDLKVAKATSANPNKNLGASSANKKPNSGVPGKSNNKSGKKDSAQQKVAKKATKGK